MPGDPITTEDGGLTAGTWDDNLNFVHYRSYRYSAAGLAGAPHFSTEEHADAEARSRVRTPRERVDVVVVIDTTGSMGDELGYLQGVFSSLTGRIEELHPASKQRWALVAYRDLDDDYVVRAIDFRSDRLAILEELFSLYAAGGGDTREVPERALEKALALSWRRDASTARVVVWVADAPHRDDQAGRIASVIRGLRDADVRVYPVAASGVDELTEYTMRAAAQLTLGRYIFLTDDSGIGDQHREPSVPCYWVTRLDYAMERVIRSELLGARLDIDPLEVIREAGTCTSPSGELRRF